MDKHENKPTRHRLHAHRAEELDWRPWVLEDEAGILEIADSQETLARDHPDDEIIADSPEE